MKKTNLNTLKLLLILISTAAWAQNQHFDSESICATDVRMADYFAKNPQAKKILDQFNIDLYKLPNVGKDAFNKNAVYEIPVVIHVISDGSALGTPYNRTDQQILEWIAFTNQVFAGTAPGILNDSNGGAVIPVKLVPAKISPNCTPINGINRVDLSSNAQFVQWGVNSTSGYNGVPESNIVQLARWDPSKYYNIYIVNKLASGTFIAAGYASFAGTIPFFDDCFVIGNVVNTFSTTMAHEIGHSLGLWHTQQGASGSTCAPNGNCMLDGDMVCDTEPMIELLTGNCVTGTVNNCTGNLYNGVEQNIMAYSSCTDNRFTQGQKIRAIAQLLEFRNNLINSPVTQTVPMNNSVTLTPSCVPTALAGSNGDLHTGIAMVKFGAINNYSETYNTRNSQFYVNYTNGYCLGTATTEIPVNTPTQLSVQVGYNYPHIVKAYIDFNNNGIFEEASEVVINLTNVTQNSIVTINVTPPSNAVLNVPLRMRVIGDMDLSFTYTGCSNPVFGQVEDYAVTILPTLAVDESDKSNFSVFKNDQKGISVKSVAKKISSVELYDLSGKIIRSFKNLNTKEFNSEPLNLGNSVNVVLVKFNDYTTVSKKIKF